MLIFSLLKQDRDLSGSDEAVIKNIIKNIDACKELSTVTRTSLGPNGITTFIKKKKLYYYIDNLIIINLKKFYVWL